MIIDNVSYDIEYPLTTNWGMKVVRKRLTSGFYRTWDYGLTSDVVSCRLAVQGEYSKLSPLLNYLKTNREVDIEFEGNEEVFGPHVDHESVIFNTIVTQVDSSIRDNTTYWVVTFTVTINTFSIRAVNPWLGNLWYPNRYRAGAEYIGEVTNGSNYGNISNYYNDTIPVHRLSFELDRDNMAEACKYFVEDVRGDGFTLPSDWVTLNPFGEEDYTHALLIDINIKKREPRNYILELDLQGYNNA